MYLSEQRGDGYWWTPYSSLLSDDFSDYLYLEQAAMRLQKYEAQLIPGLLQTPGYATELMRQSHTPPDDDRIGTLVSVRMRRAELLREDATRLDVIIDEAVLHRRPSSAEVWRDQLDHLMEAANWPAVTLRVIPFGSLHAGVDGPYTIITFDTGDHVAYLESAVGGMIVEDEVDIARCNEVWHRISSASLTTGETINFIRKMRDHAS
nr:hypothetical protein GCM10020241_06900 [Streptoalloteichus tenebrarius]